MSEEEGAKALACKCGMDENGADFSGAGGRVEEFGHTVSPVCGRVVGTEEGGAGAPASAGGDGAVFGLSDEVGAVFNELGVETESVVEGAIDLGGGVVVLLETPDRLFDQQAESGDICGYGEAEREGGWLVHFNYPFAGVPPRGGVHS